MDVSIRHSFFVPGQYSRYTGQDDDGTGLQYYCSRYYDPSIGRFVTADTIVPDPKLSQSYNRYLYVDGNPINHNDPTGHKGWGSWVGACVGAIIGLATGGIAGAVLGGIAGYKFSPRRGKGIWNSFKDNIKGSWNASMKDLEKDWDSLKNNEALKEGWESLKHGDITGLITILTVGQITAAQQFWRMEIDISWIVPNLAISLIDTFDEIPLWLFASNKTLNAMEYSRKHPGETNAKDGSQDCGDDEFLFDCMSVLSLVEPWWPLRLLGNSNLGSIGKKDWTFELRFGRYHMTDNGSKMHYESHDPYYDWCDHTNQDCLHWF